MTCLNHILYEKREYQILSGPVVIVRVAFSVYAREAILVFFFMRERECVMKYDEGQIMPSGLVSVAHCEIQARPTLVKLCSCKTHSTVRSGTRIVVYFIRPDVWFEVLFIRIKTVKKHGLRFILQRKTIEGKSHVFMEVAIKLLVSAP